MVQELLRFLDLPMKLTRAEKALIWLILVTALCTIGFFALGLFAPQG